MGIKEKLLAQKEEFKKEWQAERLMLSKLQELADNDKISNSYDVEFIASCTSRLNNSIDLTIKQKEHLHEIFHNRY